MQGRNTQKALRACTECKAKKLRCVPNREGSDVCQRCYEHGKQCAIPEPVRSRKRQSRLHTRMLHLEEMMGSLVDRVSNQSQHRITRDMPATSSTPLTPRDPSPIPVDSLMGGLVSSSEAQLLYQLFRKMSADHFPYVIVPENLSVQELYQKRPVLLQAMLVVASWQSRPRQSALERFFLKDLGLRFFVTGERSLDMLQGLLVYLTWYHFNVTEPGHNHAYRLVSLCGIMVIDLGLDRKPPRGTSQHDLILSSQPATVQVAHPTPELWSHEARRALIGAYIQSTLYSRMCRRPPALVFTPYIEQCALSLQQDSESDSDKTIIYFVQLSRTIDEIYSVFDYGDPDHSLSISDDKVQMLVKALEVQLTSWMASIPSELSQNYRLNTWGDMTGAYAHEIGLHGNLRNPPISAQRVVIMFDCLFHTESYLKRASTVSLEDMQFWTAFDWRQLTYLTMLASKISVVIDGIASDKESTARIARLYSYLEPLSTRVQELFSMTNTPQGQIHYFQSLLNQLKGIRNRYQLMLQKRNAAYCHEQSNRIVGDSALQIPDYSAAQIATPAVPSFHSLDLWADDNFGTLPISAQDMMMLEPLGFF